MRIVQKLRKFWIDESGLREPIETAGRQYPLLGHPEHTFQVHELATSGHFAIRINRGSGLISRAQVGARRVWYYTLQPDQPIDPVGLVVMQVFEGYQIHWHPVGEYFSTTAYPPLKRAASLPLDTTMQSDGRIDTFTEIVEDSGRRAGCRRFGVTGATWACLFTGEGLPFEMHVWQDADPALLSDLIAGMK